MLFDAANVTTLEEHTKNVGKGNRLQKMLRLFPQCSNAGAKTLSEFAKKNLRERQEALDCIRQENTKNVNDMINGNISPARFKTTKSTLMNDDGRFFHAMFGVNNKKTVLPTEIGM